MMSEVWLALRHLRGRGRLPWGPGCVFSAAGTALGVLAMSVVLAVMNGLSDDLQQRILQVEPHVRLTWKGTGEAPDSLPDQMVARVSASRITPFVRGEAMVVNGDRVSGAVFLGLPPSHTTQAWLQDAVTPAKLRLGDDQVVLGEQLAQKLWADRGSRVLVVSPREVLLTPPGMVPPMRGAFVGGLLRSGLPEYDAVLVLTTTTAARRLLGPDAHSQGFEIRLRDPMAAPRAADMVRQALPPDSKWTVSDWTRENKALLAALSLEKLAMFVVVGLIMVVAAFNVAGTLSRLVVEKRAGVGMIMAMGGSRGYVSRTFLAQGLIIGGIGAGVGGILGQIACVVLRTYYPVPVPAGLLPLEHVPIRSSPYDVGATLAAALLLSCLAAIVPARRASSLDPCAALRG
jgi:lipoprotein-releasing system permease protein